MITVRAAHGNSIGARLRAVTPGYERRKADLPALQGLDPSSSCGRIRRSHPAPDLLLSFTDKPGAPLIERSGEEHMSKVDRIREEIGWLKLAFGALAAVDASLVAWFAQNYATAERPLTTAGVIAIGVVTVALVFVNRSAIRRFKELEDP